MIYDIQNASMGKRLSAWLLDFILLVVLITGAATLVSGLLGYDAQSAKLDAIYERYEQEYGIDFSKPAEQQPEAYAAASEAFSKDEEAAALSMLVLSLSISTISLSVLIAYVREYFICIICKRLVCKIVIFDVESVESFIA